MYENMMPKEYKQGKKGYYPVRNEAEWEELPAVYKAMQWKPVQVYNLKYHKEETTVAKYIIFDATYITPYAISATVKVHVQEAQKILFCAWRNNDCHLYTVCGIEFENGVTWGAEWKQDCTTGAFAIYASGKQVGEQGGYMGCIPENIEKTEEGFKCKGYSHEYKNRCHYQYSNPFKAMGAV